MLKKKKGEIYISKACPIIVHLRIAWLQKVYIFYEIARGIIKPNLFISFIIYILYMLTKGGRNIINKILYENKTNSMHTYISNQINFSSIWNK